MPIEKNDVPTVVEVEKWLQLFMPDRVVLLVEKQAREESKFRPLPHPTHDPSIPTPDPARLPLNACTPTLEP